MSQSSAWGRKTLSTGNRDHHIAVVARQDNSVKRTAARYELCVRDRNSSAVS